MKTSLKLVFALVVILTVLFIATTMFTLSLDAQKNKKICCLYAYYEKNEEYMNNFKFFLENGILDNVDYYIIINGTCTVDIKNIIKNKNAKVSIHTRENAGYDFGAYKYLIDNYDLDYDYYFFINTSVIGPYTRGSKWTDEFIALFTDNVALVGTSISVLYQAYNIRNYNLSDIFQHQAPFTHVQSMMFGVKRDFFKFLKQNFFKTDFDGFTDMADTVIYGEIALSQIALKNGWNINSVLPNYKNKDYINLKNMYSFFLSGDPYLYREIVDKNDIIFIKSWYKNANNM